MTDPALAKHTPTVRQHILASLQPHAGKYVEEYSHLLDEDYQPFDEAVPGWSLKMDSFVAKQQRCSYTHTSSGTTNFFQTVNITMC